MDSLHAAGETWPLLAKTTLQVLTARRASESYKVMPEAAAAVATTASGTADACDVSAACWEEGATGAAAAAGPRQIVVV